MAEIIENKAIILSAIAFRQVFSIIGPAIVICFQRIRHLYVVLGLITNNMRLKLIRKDNINFSFLFPENTVL